MKSYCVHPLRVCSSCILTLPSLTDWWASTASTIWYGGRVLPSSSKPLCCLHNRWITHELNILHGCAHFPCEFRFDVIVLICLLHLHLEHWRLSRDVAYRSFIHLNIKKNRLKAFQSIPPNSNKLVYLIMSIISSSLIISHLISWF